MPPEGKSGSKFGVSIAGSQVVFQEFNNILYTIVLQVNL